MKVLSTHHYLLFAVILIAAFLRVPYLDRYPPSLYSDEVSQGYNAYSILKTGRDEYGTVWPVSFRSFGDWKPPLPTYIMLPSIAIFGLNSIGVRFSSSLFGTATVFLMYILSLELIAHLKTAKNGLLWDKKYLVALCCAFSFAISPWHISQSRIAMLTSVALFFLILGVVSFLRGLRDSRYWWVSGISFSLCLYSYYGMRLVVPLTILGLFVYFKDKVLVQIRASSKAVLGSMLISILLLLPLGAAYLKEPDVVFGRVKTVSIFHDQGVVLKVWDLIAQDGIEMPSKLAQFFHNKPYHYAVDIARRFFEHVDGRFLFSVGDTHPPFQIPGMGVLYLADLILLIAGCAYLIKREQKLFKFLLWLIFISILPAALTYVTPAANRTLTLVVPFAFISALGAVYLFYLLTHSFGRKVVLLGFTAVYLSSFGYFAYQYVYVLPRQHADWWHYGYKELVHYLRRRENEGKVINVSGNLSVPYIFFLFYNKVDPTIAQSQLRRDYQDDEYGFEHVSQLGDYEFIRYFSWKEEKERLPVGSLLVVKADEEVGESVSEIHTILYPHGKAAFKIYSIDEQR